MTNKTQPAKKMGNISTNFSYVDQYSDLILNPNCVF